VKNDFLVYLDDILEAIKKIKNYTKGLDFSKFQRDSKTIDAVVRNFEVMGEVGKRIPGEAKRQSPEIPWRAMSGMRDKMIHEYSGIELEVVWKTIQEDLPVLEKQLKTLKKRYEKK